MHDVGIIGAGPVGLACAIEASRLGLSSFVIDKGALVNSIVRYPARMEFFSTPELIEIGGYPFPVQGYKPTREDAIEYYRGVANRAGIDLKLYERVRAVEGAKGAFRLLSEKGEHLARHLVVATGFFDIPNRLGVPGGDLPKVIHYYREPYPYTGQRVVVIGARNSAAKTALDCHRHGATVTLVVRSAEMSDKVKYWIKPDLENRIKEGSIRAFFSTVVERITDDAVLVRTPGGVESIPNDWVLAMTGYRPDYPFLESLDIRIGDDAYRTPVLNASTFESSRPGLYLAGTVCGGYLTNKWFIENGRFHARQIMSDIAQRPTDTVPFDQVHWKTEE